MAKKTQKRPVRQERDPSGCMWGLISMFDFRHGRTTQKLISDRRRATRNLAAAGKATNKPNFLINLDENRQFTSGSCNSGNPSVKKLMEKEMLVEEEMKKETNIAEAESNGEYKKRSHRRTNRNRSKSGEIFIDDANTINNVELEKLGLQNSEMQSTSAIDMDVLIEEFFRQIQHISTKHGQHGEICSNPKEKNPEFEERFSEAIKLFISQRLINGKCETGGEEICPSKELKDALEILNSNEELSLKLLQGPKSVMVQYFENLWNSQVEKNGISNPEIHEAKKASNHSKDRKFFRRKTKQSKEEKGSEDSKTIVILKPSAGNSEKTNVEESHALTPEDQAKISNKEPNERNGSRFFLTDIKRRLKQAMGKEQQQEILPNGALKGSFKGHKAKGYKDNAGRKSPSKDHFFIEKIARPPVDKSKGSQKTPLANIYMEAKKHLSEMFNSGTGDSDFPNRQVPKSLGRILSLPEYNFSPVGSPGRDRGPSFVSAQTRFSAAEKSQKQENLDAEPCSSNSETPKISEVSVNPIATVSHEIVEDREVDIAETTEILIEADSKVEDALSEPDNSVKNAVILEVSDTKEFSQSSKHDSDEERQPPPSILTTPPSASISKKDLNLEGSVEISERRSPVSVLEPLFVEDDISPAGIRTHSAELPIEPLRIKFEELAPSAADPGTHSKASIQFEDSIFEYVKAVLHASELNWDEFYTMSNSSDPLLDPSIFEETGALPSELCNDKKLLFDCINEGLMEVYWRYFGFPLGLSFSKSTTRPAPDLNHAIDEVWKGVCWHLFPLLLPQTLENLVTKDMAKNGNWMDMQSDCEEMIVEIGESIVGDLLEETVLSCVNERSEIGNDSVSVELVDEI